MKKIFLKIFFIFLGFLSAYILFVVFTKEKIIIPTEATVANKPLPAPPSSVLETKAALVIKPVENSLVQLKETNIDIDSKEIPTFVLSGIFFSEGGNNLALINNRIVKESDMILGFKVLKIYANKVELSADGQTITLRLK